jgi:hypothetical protein
MKRLSTILLLLFIANSLIAQKKSKNVWQSFIAIETGLPMVNTTYSHFPIPLNIEGQRKKKQWGFGISIALQYDRYSSGDCSNHTIMTGRFLGNFPYPYIPYCETFQYLDLKPTVFGSYSFLQKKSWHLFAKLGGVADIPILTHQNGEFYQIEVSQSFPISIKVIDAGPIYLNRNIPSYQTNRVGLLSGLGVNYFLNKRTALRFTLQSEWYSNYSDDGGSLLFALGGINFKI